MDGFDIFEHEFSGFDGSDTELDDFDDGNLFFVCDGYPTFNKDDVIAMAKHFEVTEKDLNG